MIVAKNTQTMKRQKAINETCYMCDRPATTREHAPPLSFFPENKRHNLITVPSCYTHNVGNSVDVEYVRNIVVTDIHTNDIGREMFSAKVRKSYARGHKLRRSTFRKLRPVLIGGRETAVVQISERRLNPIIRAIACALYFHDFGEQFQHRWSIYRATMLADSLAFNDIPDNINPEIRAVLRSVPTADRDTNQPEVFKYGVYRLVEHRIIYRLVFYGGVDIYAIGLPKEGTDDWI